MLQQIKGYLAVFGDHPYLKVLVVLVVSLILAKLADLVMTRIFARLTQKTKSDLDDQILALLHRPIFISVMLIGSMVALELVKAPEPYDEVGSNIIKTLVVFVWLAFSVRLATVLFGWMGRQKRRFIIVQPATQPLFDIGAKIAVIGLAVYLVLVTWEINVSAWLASAGIVGLAIGLAAQDTFANLFAGFSILADTPYKIGDYVILDGGERGHVTKIGLRSTRILTRDQIEITIPNSIIANNKIVNESGGPSMQRRIRVPVGVAYGSDIDTVQQILNEVAEANEDVSSTPPVSVRFMSFGDSSLDFELRCWIDHPQDRGRVTSSLNDGIYRAFEEAGIEIPYPKRDLYIKEWPGEVRSEKSKGD